MGESENEAAAMTKNRPGRNTFWNTASWSTMAAFMQPLTGGMVAELPLSSLERSASTDMSHLGAATWTRRPASSDARSAAALDEAPERDAIIRCLAPASAIHRAIARPTPPKPPAMTYEAFGSKLQGSWCLMSC